MNLTIIAALAVVAQGTMPVAAQPVAIASPATAARLVAVPAGTPVVFATIGDLTSKAQVKGDRIPLQVAQDVVLDGVIVIRAGTAAVGQVTDSRETGGFGVNGHLEIVPLYITCGDTTVRFAGATSFNGKTTADAVAGLILTPLLSGRSARIAAGSRLRAQVLHSVELPALDPPGANPGG